MRNFNHTTFARQCIRVVSEPRGVAANQSSSLKDRFSSFKLNSFLSITLLLLAFATLSASAQDTAGTILGNITDPTGASIPDADVTVTNVETSIVRSVKTTGTGAFTVPNLDPGTYTIAIKMAGFQQASISNIQLSAGDRRRADASLVVGAATETVEITTIAPVLQTDTSSIGSNITQQAVHDLPLNGRNYITLVQMSPGATEAAPNSINSGTRPDDRRPSSSISMNGQSETLNDQLVDGMDNNERVIATIGVRPSIDSIQRGSRRYQHVLGGHRPRRRVRWSTLSPRAVRITSTDRFLSFSVTTS